MLTARLVFRLRESLAAAWNVAELSDVIARQPDSRLGFDLVSFEQNAKLLVADLCAFLKCNLVSAREH